MRQYVNTQHQSANYQALRSLLCPVSLCSATGLQRMTGKSRYSSPTTHPELAGALTLQACGLQRAPLRGALVSLSPWRFTSALPLPSEALLRNVPRGSSFSHWLSHCRLFSLWTTEKSKSPKREGSLRTAFLNDKTVTATVAERKIIEGAWGDWKFQFV